MVQLIDFGFTHDDFAKYFQVYPMYKAFIEPDLQTAHIKITNKFNPFTGFQNPTYILKVYFLPKIVASLSVSPFLFHQLFLHGQSAKEVTDDQIKVVLPDSYSETWEETYDIYLLPPGEDPEACQSYLRMRNRDGKYNLMFEVRKLCGNFYIILKSCQSTSFITCSHLLFMFNCCLFQEWVMDSPFIISPRITFEVSVRLLGGLMALGYTIASILKRRSHIFSTDRICIKTDWLEQINRQYVQVLAAL